MRPILTALAIALAVVACQHRTAAPPSPTAIDERQACSADADCTPVEVECCDHCNGGTVVAVHRDFAADVHREYTRDCQAVACTEMACLRPPSAVCQAGMCAVVQDDQVARTPLPTR